MTARAANVTLVFAVNRLSGDLGATIVLSHQIIGILGGKSFGRSGRVRQFSPARS
jgi:hypothetical protein